MIYIFLEKTMTYEDDENLDYDDYENDDEYAQNHYHNNYDDDDYEYDDEGNDDEFYEMD